MRDRGEMYRRQLGLSGKLFSRVRLILLGDSGVGKTSLVESLKCGYIRSLFRRSGAATLAAQAKGTWKTRIDEKHNVAIYLVYM